MNENPTPQPNIAVIRIGQAPWVAALEITLRAILRWLYTVTVFGGCGYLVFWRGESGWLFLPAMGLLWFRRGL